MKEVDPSTLPWPAFAAAQTAHDVAQTGSALLQALGLEDAFIAWSDQWAVNAIHGLPSEVPNSVKESLEHASVSSGGWVVKKLFGGLKQPSAVMGYRRFPHQKSSSVEDLQSVVVEAIRVRLSTLLQITHLEQAKEVQQALFEIASLTHEGVGLSQVFQKVHQTIQGLMDADNMFVALFDPTTEQLRFVYFHDRLDTQFPFPETTIDLNRIAQGPTWYVLSEAKPLRGSQEDMEKALGKRVAMHGAPCQDWLGVPLMENGQVQGVLVVQNYDQAHVYTDTDEKVLSFMAGQVLSVIQRHEAVQHLENQVKERTKALEEEIKERLRRERLQTALYKIVSLAEADPTEEAFYAHVHKVIKDLLPATHFYVALLDDTKENLTFPYAFRDGQNSPMSRPVGRGYTEYVMRQGKPLIATEEHLKELIDQGQVDPQYGALPQSPMHSCWLGVPLRDGESVIGAMMVQSFEPDLPYTLEDMRLLSFVATQFSHSLRRRRQDEALLRAKNELEARVDMRTRDLQREIQIREETEKQLHHQVLHDSLTGLPNRRHIRHRLEQYLHQSRAQASRLAVLYLDVDRFKVINDSLGHVWGDRVLQKVAKRLQEVVVLPNIVSRIAGDEFVVVLPSTTEDEAVEQAQKIVDQFKTPLRLDQRTIQISVSVGVGMYHTRQHTPDDIMREADLALYHAKEVGRGGWAVYDPSMAKDVKSELQIEGELRQGLDQREFVPYFQPIIDMRTDEVVGFEALMRWNHPEKGVLSPAHILPVAESTGLVDDIDWMIFDQAIEQGQPLLELYPKACLSINVSPRHFRDRSMTDRLMLLLNKHQLAPQRLRIEVTEGVLLHDPKASAEIFETLSSQGMSIALDDFGTGYSSLNYVHKFPLHTIKMDRSFVQEVSLPLNKTNKANAITQVVVVLGEALNLDIVAEGIETPAQKEALLAMGCFLGQGFLFAQPRPIAYWAEQAQAKNKPRRPV